MIHCLSLNYKTYVEENSDSMAAKAMATIDSKSMEKRPLQEEPYLHNDYKMILLLRIVIMFRPRLDIGTLQHRDI